MSCLGSAGDVFPFLAIGRELKRRGHRVSLLTNANFRPWAEKAALEFTELGSEEEYRKAIENPYLFEASRAWQTLLKVAVLPTIRPVYQFIREHFEPGSTVVVASRFALGARVAQDKLNVPTVSICLTPYALRSVHRSPNIPGLYMPKAFPPFLKRFLYGQLDRKLDSVVAPELNSFRRTLGLPPVRRIFDQWIFSPDRVIGLFPTWYATPQPDWPAQLRLTGFPMFDGGEEALSSSTARFLEEGDPPVVFTPGTAVRHGDVFFRESVLACQAARVRGLLVTPYIDQIPKELPNNVVHVAREPFSDLFCRAAVVVHSGGIGTAAQALAAGIPQLVIPLAHDQFDNADRLNELGVALTIQRNAYRANRIEQALRQLMTSKDIQSQCQTASARLRGSTPVQEACKLIETLGRLKGLIDK